MTIDYLLDTNVVSELSRKAPNPGVLAFFDASPRFLVSVILFHELIYGAECAEVPRREQILSFIETFHRKIGAGIVDVDLEIAGTASRLRAVARRKGRVLHQPDALIAATAISRGATLVTRNIKDFKGLGIALSNPFLR